MTHLNVGDKAPLFSMPASSGKTISSQDYHNQTFVLYFYPKDDTPGCTTQACGFRDALPHFKKLGVPVIGVSKDSLDAHDRFIQKHGLNFILASDIDGRACDAFGVWVEKSMYGKKYMGIQRTTFLMDDAGVIARVWPKVSVEGHADDVLNALKTMRKAA